MLLGCCTSQGQLVKIQLVQGASSCRKMHPAGASAFEIRSCVARLLHISRTAGARYSWCKVHPAATKCIQLVLVHLKLGHVLLGYCISQGQLVQGASSCCKMHPAATNASSWRRLVLWRLLLAWALLVLDSRPS